MTLTEKLNQLKAVCDAATEGPWIAQIAKKFWRVLRKHELGGWFPLGACSGANFHLEQSDAEFIAISRTAMPQLIEALVFAREQFALMSEGEGPEPAVYRDMSTHALNRIAEILEVER